MGRGPVCTELRAVAQWLLWLQYGEMAVAQAATARGAVAMWAMMMAVVVKGVVQVARGVVVQCVW